ncbi:hypothetical protein O6H91_06G006100 [Diphasiastrum complanatum]|uniref:Uncharacterized protein n=1 Tax=Diphasiastrum complanatum TaxID=34168 RepID=A0ACC2DAD4_DIPCM|nr:hypothetical protein O6H91_06G006100 [Diphasiastrum complanatum]
MEDEGLSGGEKRGEIGALAVEGGKKGGVECLLEQGAKISTDLNVLVSSSEAEEGVDMKDAQTDDGVSDQQQRSSTGVSEREGGGSGMKVDRGLGAAVSPVVVDLTIDAESDADGVTVRKRREEQESAREGVDRGTASTDIVHKVFGSLLQSGNARPREVAGTAVAQHPETCKDTEKGEEKSHKALFSGIETGLLRRDMTAKRDSHKSGFRSHHRQPRSADGAQETGHEKQETSEVAAAVMAEDEKLRKTLMLAPDKAAANPSGNQSTQAVEEQGGNSNVSGTFLQSDSVREPPGGDACNRSYRKGVWLLPELMALQAAKREQYESLVKAGYRVRNSKPEKERWQEIENFCWRQGVHRSGDQCHARWEYIAREFRKIIEYESSALRGHSYWQMNHVERKEKDLPMNFHRDLFQVMVDWMGTGKAANTGAVSPNTLIQALATSTPLPEWLGSGRAVPSDVIPSPSAVSHDCMNALRTGDPVVNIPAPFPLPGSGVDSSQTSSRNILDSEPQVELLTELRGSGKKRRTSSKGGDGAGSSVEPTNRYVVPRETTTLRADDGGLLLCNCSVVHLGVTPMVSKGEHILIKNKHIVYVGPSPLFASQGHKSVERYAYARLHDCQGCRGL